MRFVVLAALLVAVLLATAATARRDDDDAHSSLDRQHDSHDDDDDDDDDDDYSQRDSHDDDNDDNDDNDDAYYQHRPSLSSSFRHTTTLHPHWHFDAAHPRPQYVHHYAEPRFRRSVAAAERHFYNVHHGHKTAAAATTTTTATHRHLAIEPATGVLDADELSLGHSLVHAADNGHSHEHEHKHERRDVQLHEHTHAAAHLAHSAASVLAHEEVFQWGLVLDCGSGGTRMYIFQWSAAVPIRVARGPSNRRLIRKLHTPLAAQPADAAGAKYLGSLFAWAKTVVPRALWSSTPVFLRCTAGMRLLSLRAQDAIMHTVRDYIASTGFQFRRKWATVQPGAREGLMGWIAVQHERQYEAWFHGGPISHVNPSVFNSSIGMMDLGGASTQITFATQPGDEHKSVLTATLGATDYSVYSKSYLGFGVREALKRFLTLFEASIDSEWHEVTERNEREPSLYERFRVHALPCMLVGQHKKVRTDAYGKVKLVGTGDFSKCSALVKQVFFHRDGSPVVNKLQLRKLHFVAIQDFAEFARVFTGHANTVFTINEFRDAVATFCNKPAREHESRKHAHKKWLCFRGTYVYQLLRSLGFHEQSTIEFALRVRDTELSWPIGEMVYELDKYHAFKHHHLRWARHRRH